MKHSVFFIITAVIALLFGSLMVLGPDKAAEGFGIASSPAVRLLFRALGALILSMGVLNFMARNDTGSVSLRAILVFNIVAHFLSMAADACDAIVPFSKSIPGYTVHLFVGIGSLIYLIRMKRS